MLLTILLFVGTGLVAGIMSGLLGIGGGMIVVPALSYIFSQHVQAPANIIMHIAAGTSLCIMVFTTGVSVLEHRKQIQVPTKFIQILLPGLIIGAVAGVVIADFLQASVLRLLFGIFLLGTALKLFFTAKHGQGSSHPSARKLRVTSLVTGTIASMLGIGGGTISVPFLLRYKIPVGVVISISALNSLIISSVGCVTAIITGLNSPNLPAWNIGYIHLPAVALIAIPSMIGAPLGVRFSKKLNVRVFSKVFALIILLTGLKLVLT